MMTMRELEELAGQKGKTVVPWYNPFDSRFHVMIRGHNTPRRFGSIRRAKLYLKDLPNAG